tara:strand:+ start:10582 stop:11439 length:858 start_codon:yes stop_codon:yes gene_type:complete
MIPAQIKSSLSAYLKENVHPQIMVESIFLLSGGCINNAVKIETNKGYFFAKWNENAKDDLFQTEYEGLKSLKEIKAIYIPEIIAFDQNLLILEFVSTTNPDDNFWENFGRNLANMHLCQTEQFGLDYDNYIGSLKQLNTKKENWIDFFVQNRLLSQLEIGNFSSSIKNDFEKLFDKLPYLIPQEQPSLIHGDLWSGNFIVKNHSIPVLIDPAIYFGNREMDIAMSKLFGGFHTDFYDSYNEVFPLEKDWEERVNLCNLYPLLVHVNLFGGGYLNQVKNILSYYVG